MVQGPLAIGLRFARADADFATAGESQVIVINFDFFSNRLRTRQPAGSARSSLAGLRRRDIQASANAARRHRT